MQVATLLLSIAGLTNCGRDSGPPLFTLLGRDRTGISFANTITTNDSVNVQTDVFIYNGAGVAIGDIDNDGLPDIFFAGNMVSSRLYRNTGDMRFEDITESAGVTTRHWATGASMVDIDNNGYLDIYVSVSGPTWSQPRERANLLFLNNGDRTFTEAASTYGIDDTGFTTHAVFFDYDMDRDLDLFLLGNSPEEFSRGAAAGHPAGMQSTSTGGDDQLYRNDGGGTFRNVSNQAGIRSEVGFGLGVVVSDLNEDGWPDLYISNDVTPNDVLYVNNRDGTFTDKASAWLKHTSFAGMGVDIADFNNDGWADILQTDMMPADLRARKRMSGAETYAGFMALRQRGFHAAYTANTLQLSSGVARDGSIAFSEIARLAGVAYTDWSWSALFGDYDNDGYKDIMITNGYPKAVTDYDYQTAMHRGRRARDGNGSTRSELDLLEQLHSFEASNYVFRNEGYLTFTDRTKEWGMDHPSFSYGAAHADLNNDGRLDVVVNNINATAFVYQGMRPRGDARHYLQVELAGDPPNRRGIGAKLVVTAGGQKQYIYHTPYRGYMSSMDDRIHVGLGAASRVDSLDVVWPDGRYQLLTGLDADRVLTVRQGDATPAVSGARCPVPACRTGHRAPDTALGWFQPLDAHRAPRYHHRNRGLIDFSVQPLLPQMVSRQGPPLAVGDATGDGLEDLFVGGSAGSPGTFFVQRAEGGFVESNAGQPWVADADLEEWGALFFDANGDGWLDLYVASGGYHSSPVSATLDDRLYLNGGAGRFVKASRALPEMRTSTASVTAGDFNGDGRPDLFVGGRLVPRNYPYPARSYLLRNDGATFTDVTDDMAPELVRPGGMITDAVWMDFTGDGRPDLVTAGEWMPIQFYANDGPRLRNVTSAVGLPPMRGWWYSLEAGDFNGDGRPDLVAGNLGLNHTYTTSAGSRFGIYAADFTGNQNTDIVLTQESDGTEYPFFGLARLGPLIYTLGVRFPTHQAFAAAPVGHLFSASQLSRALHYQVDTFASVYLQNNGNGTFTWAPLPNEAQLSPIRGIVTHDVDGDGHLDLIVAGNLYDTEPNTPRADAGDGLWLRGDGKGRFTAVPAFESGFLAPRDVTGLAIITTPTGRAVLVANNGGALEVYLMRGVEADDTEPRPRSRDGAPTR